MARYRAQDAPEEATGRTHGADAPQGRLGGQAAIIGLKRGIIDP